MSETGRTVALRAGRPGKARPPTDRGDATPTTTVETGKLGSVLEFMSVLWGVDHGLQSASKRMEANLGITGPQRIVVRIVGRFPGIAAGPLADLLRIHPSTLTGILQRLEQRGAITRQADPGDGRRALFSLTERGREIDALRAGTIEAAVRRAIGKLSRRKLLLAQEVMREIADELERDPAQE